MRDVGRGEMRAASWLCLLSAAACLISGAAFAASVAVNQVITVQPIDVCAKRGPFTVCAPFNTTSISKGNDVLDTSATPSGAPSTGQVLAEVAKVTGNRPVPGAYYPVYSDQPRGSAGYCAWHSSGTINGVQVEFGFFFNLDGDPGCDPQSPSSLGHSQGLAALANVSGHELSEMLTDPQLNAWYDRQGAENSDKCAWTWSGTVAIGGQSWKIQGNWSNAAAAARTGYANVGCIQTR